MLFPLKSPDIVATFWGLSLYDIHVPKERYVAEIQKQREALRVLDLPRDPPLANKKKEQEHISGTISKLEGEFEKQQINHQRVLKRIMAEKEAFFPLPSTSFCFRLHAKRLTPAQNQ